ncbi:leukocyte-associated immunoglobulin-like receptor 1 isoform X2 [Lutra lutra]|uniref:leukocyte-associated immunoglobulin-like receptor 1 isoform X2 n=1 Tax=Lutra lutra TaxID=9657 RepID=UPI001FD40100|nr:leukocyte-associated immunoglobulin-like receptor 1 isoform X2 [Lutra lutra]
MNTHTEQDQEIAESKEFSGATIFGFLFQNTCSWKPSGTALCLSQALHAQHGVLPRPSIRAEPGPVIPWGQPVNIVCQGPAEFATFRLEKKGTSSYKDENPGQETQARFTIAEVNEDTAGLYHCRYHTSAGWSEPSEDLKLEVTAQAADGARNSSLLEDPQMQEDDSSSPGLSTEHVFILTGVSVASFLCVLLLALIFLYCWHQKKHRPPGCEGEEQRPQERVSPAVDMLERTPDLATVDRLPEKDVEMRAPTPTAGGPPDVTYAQLDQRILAQRTARAAPPRSMEPTADFSTYAALSRR